MRRNLLLQKAVMTRPTDADRPGLPAGCQMNCESGLQVQ